MNFTAKIRETQSLPNPHRNAGSRCRHSPLRLPESRRRLWNCSSWRHTSWVIKFLCFIVHVTFLYHVTLNVLELTFSSIFFFFFQFTSSNLATIILSAEHSDRQLCDHYGILHHIHVHGAHFRAEVEL